MADSGYPVTYIAGQSLSGTHISVRQAEHYLVVVHVDRETLSEDGGDGCCEIEHGPALAAEPARRIACDAAVIDLGVAVEGLLLAEERRNYLDAPNRA